MEEARLALAQCEAVDEVKDIRDKALALQTYARQAKNRDLERQAAEIRMRAERRWAQLYKPIDGRPAKVSTETTLSDMGVSRDQSAQWQKAVEIASEEDFETYLHYEETFLNGLVDLPRHRFHLGYKKPPRHELECPTLFLDQP